MSTSGNHGAGWRSSPRRTPATGEASWIIRRARRIVLVVLVVAGLAAFLGWVLCPILGLCHPGHQIVLASLAPTKYETVDFPPPLFVAEDIKAWHDLKTDLRSAAGTQVDEFSLDDCRVQEGDTLVRKVSKASMRSGDSFLCYLCAEGYVDGSPPTAYLVSRRGLSDDPQQRLSVQALLQRLQDLDTPAVKILFFDVGRTEPDVRRGSLIDVFPRAVEQAIQQVHSTKSGGSPLWVITSNSLFSGSGLSPRDRRSAFSYFATAALAGAADSNHDGNLSLGEIYSYVVSATARYCQLADRGSPEESRLRQNPQLWRCGDGADQADQRGLTHLLDEANKVVVVSHVPPPKVASAAPAAAEASPSPQAKSEKPSAAGSKPDEQPVVLRPSQAALHELREQIARLRVLHESGVRSEWNLTDFAPPFDRVLDQVLVDAQLACLDDVAATSWKDSSAELGLRFSDDLHDWQQRFSNPESARPRYEQDSRIYHAVRIRNEALYELPYLLLARVLSADDRDAAEIGRTMDQLAELLRVLDNPSASEGPAPWPAAQQEQWLGQLDRAGAALDSSLQPLLRRTLSSQGAAADASAGPRLRCLLATARIPVHDAAAWNRLEKDLDQVPTLANAQTDLPLVDPHRPDVSWEQHQASRLLNQIRLAQRLLHLEQEAPGSSPVGATPEPGALTSPDEFTQLVRSGSELRLAWQQLSQRVNDSLQSRGGEPPAFADIRRAETLSRLVAAVDFHALDLPPVRDIPFAAPRFREMIRPQREFVVDASPPSGKLEISDVVSAPITWTLRDRQGSPLPTNVRVQMDFDPAKLVLEKMDEKTKKYIQVAPGPMSLTTSGTRFSWQLMVRAKVHLTAPQSLVLTFLSGDAGTSFKAFAAQYAFLLPQPLAKVLALQIDHPLPCLEQRDQTASTQADGADGGQTTRLDVAQRGVVNLLPYARGTTSYRFAVVNRGRTVRAVKYRVYIVPNAPPRCEENDDDHLERVWDAAQGQPLIEESLTLKPDAVAPLSFGPAPQRPAAGSGKDATPNAAEPAAPLPPGRDFTGGILLSLREGEDPPLLMYLDFKPLRPDRYLECRQENQGDERYLFLRIRPRADMGLGLPPEGSSINWDSSMRAPELQFSQTSDLKLTRGAGDQLISTKIDDPHPSDEAKRLRLALEVDGYPRAFNFDATILRGRLMQNVVEVDREFEPRAVKEKIIVGAKDLRHINPLKVEFAVDFHRALREQFHFDIAAEGIVGQHIRYYTDRVWEVRQAPGDPSGVLAVTMQVGNPYILLNLPGPLETVIRGEVRKIGGGPSEEGNTAETKLIVDGRPPNMSILSEQLAQWHKNLPLRIELHAEDLESSVAAVSYSFKRKDDQLAEPVTKLDPSDAAAGKYVLEIPPKDLNEGNLDIWFQATDAAGNASPLLPFSIRIVPEESGAPGPHANGTVTGKIETSRGAVYEWAIRLTPAEGTSATPISGLQTDKEGHFSISAPGGTYTLHASGRDGAGEGSAEAVITVQPGTVTELKESIVGR